jgi:hypothetical protein
VTVVTGQDDVVAAGGAGDDPLTDILVYGLPVFTPEIDALVREVSDRDGLESPLAIEYVRTVPALLAWVDLYRQASGRRDLDDVRGVYLDNLKETLLRALDRRLPSDDHILYTIEGRRYSRDELISALRQAESDEVHAAVAARGPIEEWDTHDLMEMYRATRDGS